MEWPLYVAGKKGFLEQDVLGLVVLSMPHPVLPVMTERPRRTLGVPAADTPNSLPLTLTLSIETFTVVDEPVLLTRMP